MEPRADGCCIRLNRKFDRIRCSRTIIIIIMLRAQLVETSVFRIELISSFHEKVVEKKKKKIQRTIETRSSKMNPFQFTRFIFLSRVHRVFYYFSASFRNRDASHWMLL